MQTHKQHLQQLIERYKTKTPAELESMTAWQRSSYRETMKYAKQEQEQLDLE